LPFYLSQTRRWIRLYNASGFVPAASENVSLSREAIQTAINTWSAEFESLKTFEAFLKKHIPDISRADVRKYKEDVEPRSKSGGFPVDAATLTELLSVSFLSTT